MSRYARQMRLPGVGAAGQARLAAARVLVVGAGGLGSPALMYLASAGVGTITVVDADTVDLTNLQRQIMHTEARVDWLKVASARAAITAINPDVDVTTVSERADSALLESLLRDADVAIDCSDNFAARQALNLASVRTGTPLVSGSAIGFDGQMTVFDPTNPASPCYACLFPPSQAVEEVHCATMGVFAPLVGIVGTLEATEALKLLSGMGSSMVGRLLLMDTRRTEFTEIRVRRQSGCEVCGPHRQTP